MLASFYNRSVVVRRLRTTSGNKRAYFATATADCAIQNIENFEQNANEGIAKKQYKAWFDIDQDIQEGDVLTEDVGGQKYKVIAVELLGDGMGLAASEHLEAILQRHTG